MTIYAIDNILSSKPHNPHYLNRYIRFIEGCREVNEDYTGYTEKHHICPKSLFPEYKSFKEHPRNCAILTARQHFIAHWILWKAYPEMKSIQTALFLMSHKDGNKLDARTYARLSEEHSIAAKNRSPEAKRRQAETLRRYHAENSMSWYTNGKESRMIKDSDPIPDGYYPGRYIEISEETRRKKSEDMKGEKNHFYGKKHSKETMEKIYTPENRKKISDANSGRIRYTDGIREIRLKKDEIPPEGFVRGLSPDSRKKRLLANSGRIRYNNGVKEIKIKKEEIPPEGFVKGRLKR